MGPVKLLLALVLAALPIAGAAQCYSVPHAVDDQTALNHFWSIPIPLCLLPPGSNNAYADKQHGIVWADQVWLDSMANLYGNWASTGILAHEWGHLVQGPGMGTAFELQADCLAGVFMRGVGLPWQTVEQFATSNMTAGDTQASFVGHGTGPQRVNAAHVGYYGFSGQPISQLSLLCPASAF